MKQRVIDFLMGKQPQTAEVNPTSTYGADVDNFINALREQPYMQKLYNAPIQERLSDEQIAEKVANGLNLGIPELAQAQKDVGIRIPQGTEQVAQAQLGEFNKPMVVAGINNAPREGGLIQGYKQGYNLNYDNPTNTVGTRIGQALGSIGRFADSSLGRGLIAYGLSNAMGDTNPLEQAFTAGVGRQTAVTKDKAYRQNLKQMARQLEMDESEIDNIRGNITDEMYENMISSMKQIEDTKYRQMYLGRQLENTKILNDYRMAQLAQDAQQNAFKNAIDKQKLALEWEKFQNDKDNKDNTASDSQIVMNQLDELMNLHSQLPQYKASKGTKKGVAIATGALSDLGLRPDDIAAYEGVQNMMTNLVARKLAGEKGVMTDKDFDRAKKMVPNIYDTPQQAQAKYNALKTLYYANPNNVATSNTTSNNTTTQIGNYKVRVK